MSQLIQMRQRINAVATIKKITHATRLIAMSAHTRLANREPIMAHYKDEVRRLFERLTGEDIALIQKIKTTNPDSQQTLVILIGAQKGFCGNFNTSLFKFLEHHHSTHSSLNTFMSVGKKASDYLHNQATTPLESFNELSNRTSTTIASIITEKIIAHARDYKQIVVVSNYPRTFFSQKPQSIILLPIEATISNTASLETYYWPESQQKLTKSLFNLYIQATLESLIFSSLVAEQAARFQSMDNATRNANDLLDNMYRDYNKLRQTKITKELIELSGSFER